jgi:fructose-bisphosphate aldolase class II
MLVAPKILFQHCYSRYGIAAVNVFTMEQVLGLFSAAQKSEAPFIVQTTPVARNYAYPKMLLSMIQAAAIIFPKAVYAVHLDHGTELHVEDAIRSGGYTSVMIDASHDAFDRNVQRTRAVVEQAHQKGVFVEAELGVLSGVEDDLVVAEEKSLYTRPEEVQEFVTQTGCDSLAIAVGTSHGAYKFSGGGGLQFEILKEIQRRLPEYPLVLHGGSAVSAEDIERVKAAGGDMKMGASGVEDSQLQKAIAYGVCKINIATDARILWARVHREFFRESPDLFDPIIPGKTYMEEFEKLMLDKFSLLGATGKAGEMKTKNYQVS